MLTKKQQKVYDYLLQHTTYPPTIQEITDHFWWKSKRNATQYLDILEKKWYITRVDWYRWIRLTEKNYHKSLVHIPILWVANVWKSLLPDYR